MCYKTFPPVYAEDHNGINSILYPGIYNTYMEIIKQNAENNKLLKGS